MKKTEDERYPKALGFYVDKICIDGLKPQKAGELTAARYDKRAARWCMEVCGDGRYDG